MEGVCRVNWGKRIVLTLKFLTIELIRGLVLVLDCETQFSRTTDLVSCYARVNVQGNAERQPGLLFNIYCFILIKL